MRGRGQGHLALDEAYVAGAGHRAKTRNGVVVKDALNAIKRRGVLQGSVAKPQGSGGGFQRIAIAVEWSDRDQMFSVVRALEMHVAGKMLLPLQRRIKLGRHRAEQRP